VTAEEDDLRTLQLIFAASKRMEEHRAVSPREISKRGAAATTKWIEQQPVSGPFWIAGETVKGSGGMNTTFWGGLCGTAR